MISAHEYPITANLIEIADMMILNRPLGWSICAGMPQEIDIDKVPITHQHRQGIDKASTPIRYWIKHIYR